MTIRLYWGEASTSWSGLRIVTGLPGLVRDLRRRPTRIEVKR